MDGIPAGTRNSVHVTGSSIVTDRVAPLGKKVDVDPASAAPGPRATMTKNAARVRILDLLLTFFIFLTPFDHS
jgi:hypothetical protein